MESKNSAEKRFQEDIEPFPKVPGVYQVDNDTRKWWGVVVEHLIKKEEDRCGLWKDEVENLTIYAGLFSAVVTAFIIESSKSLQVNPSDVLLSRIATALERSTNSTNSATTSPISDTVAVTSASKSINALWFMSLVLSLSSALIGLVGLQWLREHLRPSTRNVPLKTLPAIVQMQADSLDAYYVPQTFTALPLLLIISIALFFVGLIEYLWDINHTVAYPSIIIISLVLGFILYTTIRPGMQGLPSIKTLKFYTGKSKPSPSIPCPYRSPQSWAFLQVIILISSTYSLICRRFQYSITTSEPKKSTKTINNWIDWAAAWPRLRDIAQLRLTGDRYSLLRSFCNSELVFSPVYDTLRALTQVKQDFTLMGSSDFQGAMFNALNAFDDFLDFDQGSQGFYTQLMGYVHEILDEPGLPLTLPRDFVSQASPERKRAHVDILFSTTGVTNLNDLDSSMPDSTMDSIPDLLLSTCEDLGSKISPSKPFGSPIAILWYISTTRMYKYLPPASGDEPENRPREDLNYLTQLPHIVDRIFEYASKGEVEDDSNTFGTSPYVKTLLHAIANIMVSRESTAWQMEYRRDATQLSDEILTNIKSRLQNQIPWNPYLFLLSSIYLHFLLVKVSPRFIYNPVYKRTGAFNKVARILMRHHTLFYDSVLLRQYQQRIFPASLEPGFTWAYLNLQYDQEIEDDSSSLLIPRWLSGDRADDCSTSPTNESKPVEDPPLPSRSNSWETILTLEKDDSYDVKQDVSVVEYISVENRGQNGHRASGSLQVARNDGEPPKHGQPKLRGERMGPGALVDTSRDSLLSGDSRRLFWSRSATAKVSGHISSALSSEHPPDSLPRSSALQNTGHVPVIGSTESRGDAVVEMEYSERQDSVKV